MFSTLALCNEVVRDLDLRSQCAFARKLGYDGLEVAPFTLGDPREISSAGAREICSIAEDEGTRICGLHWLLVGPPGLSVTTTDPAAFTETIAFGRRLVELCAELGGSYLVHGSPAQRRLEPGAEAEGRRRGEAYFAEMGEAARSAGVTYLVEPLARADTGYINSVEDAVALIGRVGSPALATMLDCYAAARDGFDIPRELRRWLPTGHIRHLHFNDPNRRGPGEGELAFGPIFETLSELGYAGSAAVEPFVYEPDGPACAARAIGFIQGMAQAHA